MNLLALDTATETCAVALLRDGHPVAELVAGRSETHSRHLMDLVDRVLQTAGIALKDVGVFAASQGPGGFTGLRIGLATLKGLAFATNRPAIGVSTLEALAFQAAWTGVDGPVDPEPVGATCGCPGPGRAPAPPVLVGAPFLEVLIDARKREIYAGRFRMTAQGPVAWRPERVLTPAAFLDELAADEASNEARSRGGFETRPCPCGDSPHVFVGNGVLLYRDLIRERLGDRAWFAPLDTHMIRAVTIGRLAWAKFQAGDAPPAAALVPVYVRPSDAEIHSDKVTDKPSR